MDRSAWMVIMFLVGCLPLHLVSAQTASAAAATAAAAANTDNQQQKQAPTTGSSQNVGGVSSSSGIEIPVSDTETTKSAGQSASCQDVCYTACDNIPFECAFIADQIPTMCGKERKECKASCDTFCSCLLECKCQAAEGCDDTCSQACKQTKELVINELKTTTGAAEEAGAGNPPGVVGPRVIYRQVDEDDEEKDENKDAVVMANP